MKFLFLFLDGIGLTDDNAEINPFAKASMPNLEALLEGHKLVSQVAPLDTTRATFLSLDTNLGVEGMPQSATGQATLLTGKNVPQIIGEHYGPKPNKQVAAVIRDLQQSRVQCSFSKCLPGTLLREHPLRKTVVFRHPPGRHQRGSSIDDHRRLLRGKSFGG